MSKEAPPSRSAPQFVVRLPDEEFRDRISEAAKFNNRSMNAEIVARLQASFGPTRGEIVQQAENETENFKIKSELMVTKAHLLRSRREMLSLRMRMYEAEWNALASKPVTAETIAQAQVILASLNEVKPELDRLQAEFVAFNEQHAAVKAEAQQASEYLDSARKMLEEKMDAYKRKAKR